MTSKMNPWIHDQQSWKKHLRMNAWFTFKSPVEIRNIIWTCEPNIHDFGFKFQPLIFRGVSYFRYIWRLKVYENMTKSQPPDLTKTSRGWCHQAFSGEKFFHDCELSMWNFARLVQDVLNKMTINLYSDLFHYICFFCKLRGWISMSNTGGIPIWL